MTKHDSVRAFPANLFAYVSHVSGWHQAGLACLSVLVFLLSTAPLELQGRIVNGAIESDDGPAVRRAVPALARRTSE